MREGWGLTIWGGGKTVARSWSMEMYKFAPFCYSGILLSRDSDKNSSMATLQQDFDIRLKLERVAHLVPAVKELLEDVADLFPPVILVLLETFARDKFSPRSMDGRRVLSTLIMYVPDNKAVEEFHGKIRAASENGVNQVITRIARSRACVDGGVIEKRGIRHNRVTKDEFTAAWSRRRTVNMQWRFNVHRHKLHPRWTNIMLKRSWTSTTPESFRVCLAGWSWARVYFATPEQLRPPFKSARQSVLLLHGAFVEGPNNTVGICLGKQSGLGSFSR